MGTKVYIVVTPFFPSPDNWRGAYCFDFVKTLKRARPNWRVEVFVPGTGDDYEIDGVTVHRFKTRELPSNIFPFLFKRYNEKSFLSAISRVGIKVSDIIVCHGHTANFAIYPLAIKKINPSCKALLHHHDLMSFGLNNGRLRHVVLYNLIVAKQLKRLHEQIDLHVFISKLCEKSFRVFPGVNWLGDSDYSAQAKGLSRVIEPVRVKNSYVLHNGVDTKIFKPNFTVKRRGKFVIGCVGNISPEKGQYDLLCAVRDLSVSVKFVGSGSDLERCRRYALAHGIDAEFLPEMRHEGLPRFYQKLDLFVLPTWLDGFGCVYTEAYACGVPFIATTRAGVEELISDDERNMWLVEPRKPALLAEKINYYINNRPKQKLEGAIAFDDLIPQFLEKMGI